MKLKLTVFTGLLFLSFHGLSQTGATPGKINYNGFYHTQSDSLNPFRFYLRFYEDGTVIGYTTAGNPQNLVPWFKKEHKSPSKGRYQIKSDSLLSFSLKSEEGIVMYEGVLLPGNRLFLDVKSLINKYAGKEEYFFWPVENLK
ncbi:MAG TPA: hypothetical protein VF476_02420 [Chitinophagaceae bacterium]